MPAYCNIIVRWDGVINIHTKTRPKIKHPYKECTLVLYHDGNQNPSISAFSLLRQVFGLAKARMCNIS